MPKGSGKVNWTLTNYKFRVEDAYRNLNGSTSVAVKGPSFYTAGIGYKLSLSLEYDGSTIWVAVAPLKGVYDSLLKWPLVGEVSITIFDQDTPAVS